MEGGIWRPEAGGDVEAATSTGGEQLQAILAGYAAGREGGGRGHCRNWRGCDKALLSLELALRKSLSASPWSCYSDC